MIFENTRKITRAFRGVQFERILKYHERCESLSGSPAKSGPLNFGSKNNFPSFFVIEKGLVHIYKNAIYYFPVLYFCFATSKN